MPAFRPLAALALVAFASVAYAQIGLLDQGLESAPDPIREGEEAVIVVRRGEETLTLKAVLGKWPTPPR